MPYRAPIADHKFILDHVAGFDRLHQWPRFEEATADTVSAVLEECGKLCEEVVAPLQRPGDAHPARLENGVVRTPPGFADVFRAYSEGGWISVAAGPDYGGMGLPLTVQSAVSEITAAACMSFQLCPLLVQGQIEALEAHAPDEIKNTYLPKLISGEWTGTMNLTEPQAGSDVGALTTKAVPQADGSYAITGQKIYITYGDHDMASNVSHLVLARLPDAPKGSRGVSLFLVPKYMPDANGAPGPANDLRVVSLEHKMGIHGSPTCVMAYEGATGWMIGAPGGGLAAMFTMMNNARLGVAVQAVGVAEAATQHALAFAMDRRQGKAPGLGTIVEHADVKRMLATMRAETFAMRCLATDTSVALDVAAASGDAGAQARAAVLTPIAKTYCTEIANAVAQIGIQVHGGMGVIEETGAAQFARDLRVTTIYEGTTGIQGLDLVGRKMADGGEAIFALLDEVQAEAVRGRDAGLAIATPVWNAAETVREATDWMLACPQADRQGGAVAYTMAFGRVLGAHGHLRAALAVNGAGPRARLATHYITQLLPEHASLCVAMRSAPEELHAISPDDLAVA